MEERRCELAWCASARPFWETARSLAVTSSVRCARRATPTNAGGGPRTLGRLARVLFRKGHGQLVRTALPRRLHHGRDAVAAGRKGAIGRGESVPTPGSRSLPLGVARVRLASPGWRTTTQTSSACCPRSSGVLRRIPVPSAAPLPLPGRRVLPRQVCPVSVTGVDVGRVRCRTPRAAQRDGLVATCAVLLEGASERFRPWSHRVCRCSQRAINRPSAGPRSASWTGPCRLRTARRPHNQVATARGAIGLHATPERFHRETSNATRSPQSACETSDDRAE